MAPRRARWQVAVENSGIDGSVGAIVRAHNAFAGGGVQLLGSGRYNKRAAVGTHQHEPIRVLDAAAGDLVIGVEADPALPPLPRTLWQDATYAFAHDAVGPSPALAARCDLRFGPPPGWSGATSPAMLAHVLMARLRDASVAPDDSVASIRRHDAPDQAAAWQDGWAELTRAQQRAALPFDWWVARFAWTVRRPWWICLPSGQTPLNAVAAARNALAAGAAGVITPEDPGPKRLPLGDHWRVQPFDDVVSWARAAGYPLIALEQGGTPLADATLPERAVLLAGHEVRGLSARQQSACELVLRLPQWGSVRSLNVASAAGLVLDAAPQIGERP